MENRQPVLRLLLLYPSLLLFVSILFLFWFFKQPGSRTLLFTLIFVFLFSLVIRVLDWNIIYYYGSHIDSLFWQNAFYADGIGMITTGVSISLVFISIILLSIFVFLLRKVVNHYLIWMNTGHGNREYILRHFIRPFFLIYLIFVFLTILFVIPFFSTNISNVVYTNSIPEKRFVSSIIDFIYGDKINKIELSNTNKDKLRSIGLNLESINKEYPLLRNSIYINKPDQSIAITPNPNIIIIFFESLSSYFIEDPEIRKHLLTSNIDNFIEKSLYFDRIVNAITPTLQGQIAVLSSSLHLYRSTMAENKWSMFDEVREQFKDIKAMTLTEYPMISKLLKTHSYSSTHIQAGPGSFGDTESFFRLRGGYSNFYSAASTNDYSDRSSPLGIWGASDADTFRLAIQWLKKSEDNPFLLTISSIDIHHPYMTETKKRGIDNNLLNCVYSTDLAFGLFWEYFKKSRYKDNTIIIITADHPIFPTNDYLQLRKSKPSYYDYIPIAIYSPFHPDLMGTRDNTIGTNIDIAPTLFELIGLDSRNSFLGLSLLSDRKSYPYYIGRINLESKFNTENTFWSDKDQAMMISYLKYLSMNNKLFKE